jgi:anaerobic selenocysteine-containing dehydrogenase
MFYHPKRILEPLKRGSDGAFSPISRDQALDEICQKMMAIRDRLGDRSMGIWKGEAIGFLQQEEYARRFARALGTPNYFSNDSACFNSRL